MHFPFREDGTGGLWCSLFYASSFSFDAFPSRIVGVFWYRGGEENGSRFPFTRCAFFLFLVALNNIGTCCPVICVLGRTLCCLSKETLDTPPESRFPSSPSPSSLQSLAPHVLSIYFLSCSLRCPEKFCSLLRMIFLRIHLFCCSCSLCWH